MQPLTITGALNRVRGPVAPGGAPLTSNAEVWAIVRFDQNNEHMEVFWSEKNVAGAQIIDTQGLRPYGSHAEPVFIRNYPTMVSDYGVPGLIEIFLSRSPCATKSALMTEAGVPYPQGCGPKLRLFAANNPGIQIRVMYDVVYAGNPANPDLNTQAASNAEIAAMNTVPNLQAQLSTGYAIVNP
jgi:hypothetical protein